jgi:hypothetical protein
MRVLRDLTLTRLAAGPFGPTRLALVLAMIALPAIVIGAPAYEPGPSPHTNIRDLVPLGPLAPAVLAATISSAIASALVAAPLGGWVERRHPWLGAGIAFVLAWIVGILALPIGPAVLQLPYGCCYLALNGTLLITTPASAVRAVMDGLLLSPALAPVPFAALLVGVIVWARAIHTAARDTQSIGDTR